MKKIVVGGLLKDRIGFKEMAMASSKDDKELIGIDIVVYGNEHLPRHGTCKDNCVNGSHKGTLSSP
jgi:hypothetical protein